MTPTAAALLVDVQNDCCPGGTLPVSRGTPVYITRHWQPPVTSHFEGHGGIWAPHCIDEIRRRGARVASGVSVFESAAALSPSP